MTTKEAKPHAALPLFLSEARPQRVPPELLALAADAQVAYEYRIGRQNDSGICRAGDHRETIEATITRQAEGYFTVNEAAQVLADSRPGLNPTETVKRFLLAHSKGELPIHQAGSRFPLEKDETIRDFSDLLAMTELDSWLRKSAGYGFPPVAAAESLLQRDFSRVDATHAPETPKQRRTRLLAMIDAEVAADREHGALARITKIEKRTRPSADRSNIGKDIKKARKERDAERRGGGLSRLLR